VEALLFLEVRKKSKVLMEIKVNSVPEEEKKRFDLQSEKGRAS